MRSEKEILNDFAGLACRLSPENLCCDGEISRAEVNRRLRQIQKKWKALEKELGRVVSEDQVWDFMLKKEVLR
jgi:hypothetical protein